MTDELQHPEHPYSPICENCHQRPKMDRCNVCEDCWYDPPRGSRLWERRYGPFSDVQARYDVLMARGS